MALNFDGVASGWKVPQYVYEGQSVSCPDTCGHSPQMATVAASHGNYATVRYSDGSKVLLPIEVLRVRVEKGGAA